MTLDVKGLARADTPAASGSLIPPPPRRWKTRILLPSLVVLTALVLIIVSARDWLSPRTPVTVVPVVSRATSEGHPGESTVVAAGWIEPDPFPQYVAALAPGVVDEVLVLEGEPVEKDQVVARLVSADAELALESAESELAVRRAEQSQAEADLIASQETLESLVDRQREVKASAARVDELEAKLARLDAVLEGERAGLAALDDELVRKGQLVESGAVSRGELRRLELAHEAQRAMVAATEGERPVIEGQRDAARASLEAAEQHTRLLIEERHAVRVGEATVARAAATVRRATAARDEARLRLDRMEVHSPVAGIVLRRLVSPGSRLMLGGAEHAAHVIHVYDPHELQVRVDVPLADAAQVGVDQEAEIVVEVLPHRTFHGRVARLVHEADVQKNTVEVKVAIADPSPELKPEMLARVRFLASAEPGVERSRTQLLVPSAALRQSAGATTVWLVAGREGEQGVAAARPVTVRPSSIAGWSEVVEGLQPGDWLVHPAPADLADGDRLTVLGEAETPEGG